MCVLLYVEGHSGQLFTYLQTIQSYLAPPTCAVFLIGMLWPGLTEVGALSSMLFGLAFGIVRISLDVAYPQPHCGDVDDRPSFVKLHFMYYGEFDHENVNIGEILANVGIAHTKNI